MAQYTVASLPSLTCRLSVNDNLSHILLLNDILTAENLAGTTSNQIANMTDTQGIPPDVEKQVQELREWINRQPHLPKDLEDKLLHRFLHSCYYDMEKTKKTVELFFSIRSNAPELMQHRDPLKPPMQTALKIVNLAQYIVPGNRSIWIWQLNDPGLENYDYTQDARMFFMSADAWLLDNTHLADEDVIVMDVKDVSMKMLTKVNLSVARKLSKYQEEAMPLRLKQIHVINAPPVIDKVYALLKPLLKQEIIDMVHFHPPKSVTLYNFISKENLPEDYGGQLPTMAHYMDYTTKVILEKRTILLNENFWRVDKKAKNSEDVGTFRTLAID